MKATLTLAEEKTAGQERTRRILLFCGMVSTVYYFIINIIVPLQWPEYNVRTQTVSELSAIGAPTRTMWVLLVAPYPVLLAAFGFGVIRSALGNRLLRIMGILIIAYAVLNIYWPPMHLRETIAAGGGTLTDTLHITWAMITLAFNMAAMTLGAIALGKGFRIYTIITFIIFVVFGIMIGMESPNLSVNAPTPSIGITERINMAAFMIWIVVLGAVLWRRDKIQSAGTGSAG